MKKNLFSGLLILTLLLSLSVTGFAESATYDFGQVTFTSSAAMDPDQIKGVAEAVKSLQPGDDLTVKVTLKNEYKDSVDWYMKNPIGEIPEDGTASGGAYTYKLIYSAGGTATELYNSEKVGGDVISSGAPEGLKELNNALKDYFFLGTMASGGTGVVTLEVALEGETQGNSYQGARSVLDMQFAAEVTGTRTVVQTGDHTNVNINYIVMGVAGLLALVLAVDGMVQRRKAGRKEG